MRKWLEFRQCPHCGYDLLSGDGERGCAYGDCPYMPEELDVLCEQCRFNFLTMEGNNFCEDPLKCEYAPVALAHVENFRRWAESQGITIPKAG